MRHPARARRRDRRCRPFDRQRQWKRPCRAARGYRRLTHSGDERRALPLANAGHDARLRPRRAHDVSSRRGKGFERTPRGLWRRGALPLPARRGDRSGRKAAHRRGHAGWRTARLRAAHGVRPSRGDRRRQAGGQQRGRRPLYHPHPRQKRARLHAAARRGRALYRKRARRRAPVHRHAHDLAGRAGTASTRRRSARAWCSSAWAS